MVDRVCQWCGKGFQVRPYKVNQGKGVCCSHSCSTRLRMTGKRSNNWRGGRHKFGVYIAVHAPHHPNASVQGGRYVLEHRLVASEMLGRPLTQKEIVHHINGNTTDNRPENLQVMTQGDHVRLHFKDRKQQRPA